MGKFLRVILFCSISAVFADEVELLNHDHDLLWCSQCGINVGDASDLFNKPSPGAIKSEYKVMFGKNITVQTLINPYHFEFDIVTSQKALCADRGRYSRGDSWFPGYSWRICTCPSCRAQLGWTFEKALSNDVVDNNQNETFHALITTSLYGKNNDPILTTAPISKLSAVLNIDTKSLIMPTADEAPAAVNNIPPTVNELIQPKASDNPSILPGKITEAAKKITSTATKTQINSTPAKITDNTKLDTIVIAVS